MVGMLVVGGVTMIMITRLIAPGVDVWTQWQMYISLAHMSAGVQSVCYYKFLSVCRLSFKFLLDLQFSKKHSHVIVKWVKYLRQKLSNVSAPIFPKYFFNITICPSWQQLKLLSKPLAFLHAIKKCGGWVNFRLKFNFVNRISFMIFPELRETYKIIFQSRFI